MNLLKGLVITVMLISIFSCNETKSKIQEKVFKLSMPEKVASQYGLSNFKNIKTIEFSFNLKKKDNHIIRHWKWNPSTNQVALLIDGKKNEFVHNHCILSKEIELDKKFTNDSYWLLFPYHLIWDKQNYEYVISQQVVSPISKDTSTKMTINYLNGDGYTPNDIYELFLDKNNEIKEWIYRKNGNVKPTKVTSWEEIIDVGGVKISTLHVGNTGDFKVWFDHIQIEK